MRFDLLSLKLFVAVCEERSIAHAADREHIAASAVSKRISDLEGLLKASLFRRVPKGLELTPSAHALLSHARVVMGDIAQMESELADHAKGVCGEVRVHASVSTIVQHLPRDLRDFLSAHEAIRIEVEEGTSQQVVKAVAENASDIGIFGGCQPEPGLRVLPYRSDTLVTIMPVGHPLSDRASVKFADLIDYDLVGPRKGSYLDSLVLRAAADLNRVLKLRIRVNGFETVCSMTEAQLGVGLVPEYCAKRYAAAGRVVAIPLDEHWATRDWKICVRDVVSLPPPVRLLVEHLSQEPKKQSGRVIQMTGSGRRRLIPASQRSRGSI
jgi:DNA-binding transcriptional LysR family regulator